MVGSILGSRIKFGGRVNFFIVLFFFSSFIVKILVRTFIIFLVT